MTTPLDRTLLRSYLHDHLTGAEAGRARALDMASRHAGADYGPELSDLANQLVEEHQRVARIIDDLGLRQPLAGRALARVAEAVGRWKPNGRLLSRSPVTPLLEVELLRSAVSGKQGLWETLAVHADELGLDAGEMAQRTEDAAVQSERLEQIHGRLRPQAFSHE